MVGRGGRPAARRGRALAAGAVRARRVLIHNEVGFGDGLCRNLPPSFCVGRPGQRLGPNPVAAPSAARVVAGRMASRWCAWSPGSPQGLRVPGSPFVAVVDRGCATRGPPRGGRRVAVRRRQPTAGGGWRRTRPGRGCSTFARVLAGTGPRWRWGLLWRVAAAMARRRWYPGQRIACRVALPDVCGAAELGWPSGSQVPGLIWLAARHTCTSAINSAGTGVCRWAAPAGASAAALRRAWSASSVTSCDRAFRYGPQSGSAASRRGMPGSHGNSPRRRPR